MMVLAWDVIALFRFACRRSPRTCAMQERAIDDGYTF